MNSAECYSSYVNIVLIGKVTLAVKIKCRGVKSNTFTS